MRWQSLKDEAKTATAERDAVRTKLTQYEQREQEFTTAVAEKTRLAEEAAELQRRVQEQEQELMGSRIEATQVYQTKVAKPMTDLHTLLGTLATRYKLDPDALIAAVSAEDPNEQVQKLSELGKSMLAVDQQKFYTAAYTFGTLIAVAEELKTGAAATLLKVKTESEAARITAANAAAAANAEALNTTLDLLGKKFQFFADADVLKGIRADLKDVDLDNITPTSRAMALAAGAALPKIIERDKAQRAKIEELEAQVKLLTDGGPGPGGPGGGLPVDDKPGGFLAAMNKGLSGAK